jgi:hypothetical protein
MLDGVSPGGKSDGSNYTAGHGTRAPYQVRGGARTAHSFVGLRAERFWLPRRRLTAMPKPPPAP